MQRYNGLVQDTYGNIKPGASISVTSNTGGAVTIYADNVGSVLSQTGWISDNYGKFFFYGADGQRFNVYATFNGQTNSDLDVICDDPADDVTNLSTTFTTKASLSASTGSTLVGTIQSGTGAVARTQASKNNDVVSVLDFGVNTNPGTTDMTVAFTNALATGLSVYVPSGTYLISAQLSIGYGQWLIGAGMYQSIITCSTAVSAIVALIQNYGGMKDIQVTGDIASRTPLIGVTLYGLANPCVHNKLENVLIQNTQRGLVLDGYQSLSNVCYWNQFDHVLILKPAIDGVLLTKSGAGDTPNSNHFNKVHVYSNGATNTGHGFYVQYGNFFNTFTDCNSDLATTGPTACFRVGANATNTVITNQYTETAGTITNLQLDAGSTLTTIVNLIATSGGTQILDNTTGGGKYLAYGAGFPDVSKLGNAMATQLKTGAIQYNYFGADPTQATATFYEHLYNNAAPASGTYNRSAICWNTNVGVSNAPTGWVCTVGGTPGTWVAFGDRYLEGSVTFNPGLVATGAQSALSSITVTGCALGDVVECSFTNDMLGMVLFGYVQAANTVKIGAFNLTGAGVTLTSGTVYVRVKSR